MLPVLSVGLSLADAALAESFGAAFLGAASGAAWGAASGSGAGCSLRPPNKPSRND